MRKAIVPSQSERVPMSTKEMIITLIIILAYVCYAESQSRMAYKATVKMSG
jgi:hypothetical protein